MLASRSALRTLLPRRLCPSNYYAAVHDHLSPGPGTFGPLSVRRTTRPMLEYVVHVDSPCHPHKYFLKAVMPRNLCALSICSELLPAASVFMSRHLSGCLSQGVTMDVQIRNTACLGGNICTGSPISDLNPIWMACRATFDIAGQGTKPRTVPARDFFLGYRCALQAKCLLKFPVLMCV